MEWNRLASVLTSCLLRVPPTMTTTDASVPGLPTSFTVADWFALRPERQSRPEDSPPLASPAEGLPTSQTLTLPAPLTGAAPSGPPLSAAASSASSFSSSGSTVDPLAGVSPLPVPPATVLRAVAGSEATAAAPAAVASAAVRSAGEAAGPQIMVQWDSSATEAERSAALAVSGGLLKELILSAPMKARGEGVLEVIRLPAGANVEAALATYGATAGVRFAEVDQLLQVQAISNDPQYRSGSLWGMYGSDSPAAVGPAHTTNPFGSNAEAAWNQGFTGSKSVFVGLLDEGIDYEHQDLAANIWLNPYEIDDGIDNDGNGYVDDLRGWNFFDNTNAIYDLYEDDHGTHVAGTIGAVGGNGVGVAGVSWDVTMISSKFIGPGGGYISGAILALDYITDLKWRHGLNIVATNNSWIGGGNSQAMQEAIVRSAQKDILFVVASGNDFSDNDALPSFPSGYSTTAAAGYDSVVAVASIDQAGQLSSFSNYGSTTVDLGAPGSGILSTTPWNSYQQGSGTSMAAPHVTGAIALYASKFPGSTAEQIRTALLASTTPTPSLQGLTSTGGRLDVLNFLNTVAPPAFSISAAQPYLAEGQANTTPFQFQITRHGNTTGQDSVSWQVAGSGADPANGDDFQGQVLPTGSLTFAAGETTKTIMVQAKGDTLQERSETFMVSLSNPSTGVTLAAGKTSASGLILNDDGVILATNPTPITIPMFGPSLPSSSSVTVSSSNDQLVSSVEVTLNNLYHNSLDDVDILLVGPTGARSVLMSDAGGDNPVNGINLTFSLQAAAAIPDADAPTSGIWRPVNYYIEDPSFYERDDAFDALAPAGPYNADFSVFNGTNPNGIWRLFVGDDTTAAAGKIIDGWSLSIQTQPQTSSVSLAVSPGRVVENGPINLVYTFRRIGSTANSLSVNYSVAGTATLGTDYTGIPATPANKTITFAPGSATATLTVDPSADVDVEADETVALTLLEGSGYTLGTVGQVVGTIQDDDTIMMEGAGATRLLRDIGNRLYAQTGTTAPVSLKFRGRPITQSSFSGWESLAAETFSGVNQMIWKNVSGNYLSLWTMDSNWNWISSTGEWGLHSPGALLQESNFGQDFNANGIIGLGDLNNLFAPLL